MDSDVSWANFADFDADATSPECVREKPWESTPPDGSVLHSSPKTSEKKTSPKTSDLKARYGAPGSEYTVDDISDNGMDNQETDNGGNGGGPMVIDNEGGSMNSKSPPSGDGPMITESPTAWPTAQITS